MVNFYAPQVQSPRVNAVHEQQERLRRYYHSVAISAVAAEMDRVTREIHDYYSSPETVKSFVEHLEKKAA